MPRTIKELLNGPLAINPLRQTDEALKPLPTCKGILLFTDNLDRPIQLLIAANIRRTARARLIPPDPTLLKKRADITQITRKIYYCPCYNYFTSTLKHYQIAKAIYPANYNDETGSDF